MAAIPMCKRWPPLAKIGALAALYTISAQFGFALAGANPNVTAYWPPTGIAVAALLLCGSRVWPGIALGAFIANVTHGANPFLALAFTVGNTLAPLASAAILRRLRFDTKLPRIKDVMLLLFVGAPVPMVISATFGTLSLVINGQVASSAFAHTWSVWWIGDTMGVVLVAPLLLSFMASRFRDSTLGKHPFEAAGILALTLATSEYTVRNGPGVRFVVLPVALWAAVRLEQQGAALIVALLATFGVVHAAHHAGPGLLDSNILVQQGLNATIAGMLLSFAAVARERRRAQTELANFAAELEQRVAARTEDLAIANEQLEREVAERRRTEDALRASENRLADAQRMSKLGSFEFDAQTHDIFWSEEMFHLYGLDPADGPPNSMAFFDIVRIDHRERVHATILEAMEKGTSVVHEYPIVSKDGTQKWVQAWLHVVLDDEGSARYLRGTCQDITERKMAEEAKRASEQLFRALVSSAPDAVIVADRHGKIVLSNEQTTALLGYEPNELLGRSVDLLLPPEVREAHAHHRDEYLETAVRRPMGQGLELKARRKDGSSVPVDISLAPVDSGDRQLVFALMRDASERRRVEDALRSALAREHEAADHLRKLDQSKNAFLSAVSHELRTPLTAILGFAELLGEDEVRASDEMTTGLVERLNASATRLADLLSDLLDIDRLHRGILEPHRRPMVLRDIVERALVAIEVGKHELTVDVDDVTVMVDPAQTERIVENLVTNAVKYSRTGTKIHVEARADDTGGANIDVSDDGSGVPEDIRASIFEPFVRGDVGTFTQGTGIGLALVDRFARLHGGSASVTTSAMGGALFHVSLPGPAHAAAASAVA